MSRKPRDENDLRKLAEEHLTYEVAMLHDTAEALAASVAQDETVHNALVESFTIHLRALIDFLWPNNPRADDVIANDFFYRPSAWDTARPAFPVVLDPARQRAGKEVAHLTYARLNVKPDDKRWPYIEMANAVLTAFHVFVNNAPASRIGVLADV